MVTINHLIVPAARALRRTGTSLYTHAHGFFRVYFGFLQGSFRFTGYFQGFSQDFSSFCLGFIMVYVKSAENQDCRTADSAQRVIKHVLGFAKPGTSIYNISTYWKATKYCNGHQKSGSQQSYRKSFGHSTSASCFFGCGTGYLMFTCTHTMGK